MVLKLEYRVSPLYSKRPPGRGPDTVDLHRTTLSLDQICDPDGSASFHYYVAGDGRVTMLVQESRRAKLPDADGALAVAFWNVGGRFPKVQMEAGAALCAEIWARRGLSLDRFRVHDDMEDFDLFNFYRAVLKLRHRPPDPSAPLAA